MDKGLSVNLDKTKVMVFQAWIMRSEPEFFLEEEKVAHT